MSKRSFYNESNNAAGSVGLPAGIHEDIVISHIYSGYDKSKGATDASKQFNIIFRKIDSKKRDLGSNNYGSFKIDQEKSYAIDSLGTLVKHMYAILELFYEPEELDKVYDPFKSILLEKGEKITALSEDEFDINVLRKNRLEFGSRVGDVEKEAVIKAIDLLNNKSEDFGNKKFRLKLIEIKGKNNNVFIEPPRFGDFIEPMSVLKKNSNLYKK